MLFRSIIPPGVQLLQHGLCLRHGLVVFAIILVLMLLAFTSSAQSAYYEGERRK